MKKEALLNILNHAKRLLSQVINTPKGIQRKEVLTERIYSLIKPNPKIDKILNESDNIWLGSDWHLWNIGNYENDYRNQLIQNQRRLVKPNDAFIYLGDFAHRLSTQENLQEKLNLVIKNMSGKMIMILGNHDIFDSAFYRQAGFLEVTDGFIWRDLVFTHSPINIHKFPNIKYNIHGHTHDWDHAMVQDYNLVVYSRATNNSPILLEDLLANNNITDVQLP